MIALPLFAVFSFLEAFSMNQNILSLAREHAPCYIYDYDRLRTQAETLHTVFPDFDFLFSVKANPYPPVLKALCSFGIGADAASAQEVLLAEKCGMPRENIYFSAAGKSDKALLTAWEHGYIIADSLGEVERIGALAARKGETRAIGVRINPDFSIDGGKGHASKFGIDEADLPRLKVLIAELPVTVEGLHVHLKSQNLDADVLGRYYRSCWELAKRISEELKCELKYVNFGGGVGIAYDLSVESPLDFARLRTYTDAIAAENASGMHARLLIESGRFLTGQMGHYFLRVVDKKVSCGKTYVIVENCMNGLQKPAIAAMLRHALGEGELTPQEPMFTAEYAFPITAYGDVNLTETVDIVGNLCCAQDVLKENFTGPALSVGDLIEVGNAGSYACTLTAQRFSSHLPPEELLVDGSGNVFD